MCLGLLLTCYLSTSHSSFFTVSSPNLRTCMSTLRSTPFINYIPSVSHLLRSTIYIKSFSNYINRAMLLLFVTRRGEILEEVTICILNKIGILSEIYCQSCNFRFPHYCWFQTCRRGYSWTNERICFDCHQRQVPTPRTSFHFNSLHINGGGKRILCFRPSAYGGDRRQIFDFRNDAFKHSRRILFYNKDRLPHAALIFPSNYYKIHYELTL